MRIFILLMCVCFVVCLNRMEVNFVRDYFDYKEADFVTYFSCESHFENKKLLEVLTKQNKRVAVCSSKSGAEEVDRCLLRYYSPLGVLLDGRCDVTDILVEASESRSLDDNHFWLVLVNKDENETSTFIEQHFSNLNLSVDADIVVARNDGDGYQLIDVFNYGKIQGNLLEIIPLGSWSPDNGINTLNNGFKYYSRWNFNNLTLRAVSVVVDQPKDFPIHLLYEEGYSKGIAAMTKIASQLLVILKEKHNFRFNYTIVERFVGPPNRSTAPALTNTLFWREQDLASSSARIFPVWLQWVDIYYPPTTYLQTKFYYLIPDKGVGPYENRFLTPMSLGVWWCTLGACLVCTVVLAGAAWLESRPTPVVYAFFSVFAVVFQQDFIDNPQEEKFISQGRRFTLLVVGLTSMLLYNYYTSSVVSWLLSAVTPSIGSLDELIHSDLELIFEDTGYSRGWLDTRTLEYNIRFPSFLGYALNKVWDHLYFNIEPEVDEETRYYQRIYIDCTVLNTISQNPGNVYYFSGFKNVKEDELRDKKVNNAKRTLAPLQPISTGIELIKTGKYAYHTEPYIASQVISRAFRDGELCELGALQMMRPSPVYIMTQKRSPYKQFFVWSLLRLSERGHVRASRERFSGVLPACSGRRPRALALGQAAPAFAVLLQVTVLSLIILMMEKMHARFRQRTKTLMA